MPIGTPATRHYIGASQENFRRSKQLEGHTANPGSGVRERSPRKRAGGTLYSEVQNRRKARTPLRRSRAQLLFAAQNGRIDDRKISPPSSTGPTGALQSSAPSPL